MHDPKRLRHSSVSSSLTRVESITSCQTETDPLLPFKRRCPSDRITWRHWALLFFACSFLFGNYFCYELPSALNLQLHERMGSSYETWQYQLNMLFTAVSTPNIICPLLSGIGIDRLGTNTMLISLTAILCTGQAIFALGVTTRSFWLMVAGRVLFGIGGGSLEVCQGKITTDWFRGRALAFAMALTLTFGRIATALNYNLSPWLDERFSEDWVCWFGFALCLLSAGATVITMVLDSPQSRAKAGIVEADAPCTKKPIMNDSGLPDDLLLDDDSESIFSEDENMNLAHLAKFTPSFWLLNIILLALYGMEGAVQPFNHISSDFLQTKWYPGNAQAAGAVQSIPDTMSAFLSPALGYMTDRVGHRGHQLLISGAVICMAHLTLGFTYITPIVPLIFLGIFYASFGSALWPSFALVVEHYHLGTAYGIATAALNIGLSVVPIIVGRIRAISTFAHVELFFAVMAGAGTLAAVALLVVGSREGSPLEKVHVDEQLINSPKDGGLTTRWVTEGYHAIVPHRYSTTSWVDDTGAIHHVIGATNIPPTSEVSLM
ncbi:hypothetical protein INT44_006559 [Umbelopsis vinacea]|uniref:Lysosomal dipeptide transporter MFSD1 n=1 Tax=Umbelopsis vinacea TaxID=44442 RepID=A0A8H7PTB1_9FUNG|nr:hypothetical protein INT44_006559 [Umbelopsis vinacea]